MFYDDYFSLDVKDATPFKISYLKSLLNNNKIYKFIPFDDDEKLNEIKLQCLNDDNLWFSHFRKLNDPTEFEISYRVKKVRNKLGKTKESIDHFIKTITEIYDVCSFSYVYEEYMWDKYANKCSGICLEFDVDDLDMLYPVEYKLKSKIDFDKMIINSFKIYEETIRQKDGIIYNDPLVLYPWVVKNPFNGILDSTKEKEVRLLYSPYEYSEFNNGIINENIKNKMSYNGINVKYKRVKLNLNNVIFGSRCNSEIVEKIEGICKGKNINYRYQSDEEREKESLDEFHKA